MPLTPSSTPALNGRTAQTATPSLAPRGLIVIVCGGPLQVPILPVTPKPALCDPSLKALVVPGLSDAGDHVQEQSAAQKKNRQRDQPLIHLMIHLSISAQYCT